MDREPLISVIIPVYNVEKYLKKCVESVSSQTYKNLEIILVDDGSIDESGKMCDEFALKDYRIKVVHKDNGGLSSARNAGLDIASGQYISFVDSDDYISESYLDFLYNRIIEDHSEIVISGYTTCYEKNDIQKKFSSNTNEVINKIQFWEWLVFGNRDNILYGAVEAWSKLYIAEVFSELRFPEIIHEDEAILYDVIDKCHRISVTDSIGYMYFQRSESIMHKDYSVERLSAPMVMIERSRRFYSDELQELAECTLLTAITGILYGIKRIPNNDPDKKDKLSLILSDFKKMGKMLRKKTKSKKFMIKSLLFSISPKIYMHLFIKDVI